MTDKHLLPRKNKRRWKPLSEEEYGYLCDVRRSDDDPRGAWKSFRQRLQNEILLMPEDIPWSERQHKRVSWHEAGHALVAHRLGGEVTKIEWEKTYINYPDSVVIPDEIQDTVTVAGHVVEAMKLGRVVAHDCEGRKVARRFRERREKELGVPITPQERRSYIETIEAQARAIAEEYPDALDRLFALAMGPLPVEQEALMIALRDVPNGDLMM